MSLYFHYNLASWNSISTMPGFDTVASDTTKRVASDKSVVYSGISDCRRLLCLLFGILVDVKKLGKYVPTQITSMNGCKLFVEQTNVFIDSGWEGAV